MDIEKLRTVALDLQKENSKLKESYLLLSSRLSKLVPLIKDQLANWDWDLSDKDVISSFEKSDDDPSENTTVPGGCLMLLTTMNIFRTNVYCCKFCSRDKFLACGCFNGNIIMYRFSTSSRGLKHIRTISGHKGLVTSINWIKGDDRIVTTSIDKSIRVWKPVTGECVSVIHTDMMVLSACLFTEREMEFCVASGSSKRIIFSDLASSQILHKMEFVSQVNAIVEYMQYLIVGTDSGEIIVINNSSHDIIHSTVRAGYQVHFMSILNLREHEYYLAVEYRNNIIELFLMFVKRQ